MDTLELLALVEAPFECVWVALLRQVDHVLLGLLANGLLAVSEHKLELFAGGGLSQSSLKRLDAFVDVG